MKKLIWIIAMLLPVVAFAQQEDGNQEASDTAWKKVYRGTNPRINDLVHTKLDVRFDYDKSQMMGREWLTLIPHFYSTDSVLLDAKGMEFKEVAIMNGVTRKKLNYKYNGSQINIKLDRLYTGTEKYTLYFDYISKPEEVKSAGSAAITDAKGLYFINPKGETPNKPTQIWTQGETEANSVWMVTIDKPNQKTTEEISMTVPAKYVTLSNGLKTSEMKNADGTRTDTWKMDLPHAPYLFFMGVGDFAITKDTPFKGKEVSYYTEPDQAKYAKAVFGETPAMIKFFSDKLGVDFPWQKYSQIVGRDYVSGAMENTTATLHQESAYQNFRQLADGNAWEETIAHELFHQWFGDLVTAESWSNLTVNESFANYSEYLWDEFRYGKDYADAHNYEDMQGYIASGSENKNLVRFHYSDKEDMFDAVSYNKGGRILHMLRNLVGDDAFFASLKNYLTTNKFKPGEAQQLRLAFEETTGKDLNWFFNQWYYGSGHPELKISYNSSITGIPNTTEVVVSQTQKSGKAFMAPIAIDVYTGGKPTRYNVWLQNLSDTFYFATPQKVDFINVDAEKTLLASKTDNKTEEQFIAQYKFGKNYLDRLEALNFLASKKSPELAKGLNDRFAGLRQLTINKLATSPYKADKVVLEEVERIVKTDRDKKVKAAALNYLAKTKNSIYKTIFESMLSDSSYSVAGAALNGLIALDETNAYLLAKKYSVDAKGSLAEAIADVMYKKGSESDFDFIAKSFDALPLGQEKITAIPKFAGYLKNLSNLDNVKTGIDKIINFRNQIPEQFIQYVDALFTSSLNSIGTAKGAAIQAYIDGKMK